MPINLEQKQQIASCFAKDYVLNEKDDCVTLFTFKGICNITFKYNENGSAFPGLAIWVFRGRQDFIQKFRAVNNQGFKYNQRQIVKNEGYGWVAFYRDGCKTQQEVYEQIVNPGREKDKWKSFYDYLISELSIFVKQLPEDSTGTSREPSTSQSEKDEVATEHDRNHPRNLIFFGAPGTGKSHKLSETVEAEFIYKEERGYTEERYERVTFYPTYSYAQFVGSYKPVMKNGDIAYEFVPGPFLRVLVKALNHPENKYCLVVEEINRANAAAVFGDMFQLLDRGIKGFSEYDVTTSNDLKAYLDRSLVSGQDKLKEIAGGNGTNRLKIPSNMYIWATMNSADQGVFPMDTAFKRRWEFEYISIDNGEADCNAWTIGGLNYNWNSVRKFLNDRLADNGVNEDKLMGPFFVKPENGSVVSDDQFKSKVLMYLWEDAARMCRRKFFADSVKTFSDLMKKWPDVFNGVENWEEKKNSWRNSDGEKANDVSVEVAQDTSTENSSSKSSSNANGQP